MQREPRYGPIDLVCIHTNEGPETENGAAGLAGYLERIDGGYNAIFDDRQTVTTAADNEVVWGAGGVNGKAIHGCLIHFSRDQWVDQYSAGELAQAAAWVAAKCKAYGIPAVRLTPDQVAANGPRGICGHVDVSATFAASMGHTDPGPNFPWDAFLASVNTLLNPPAPINFAALKTITAFVATVTRRKLHAGDRGPNVAKLNALLARHGYRCTGDAYGVNTTAAVGHFKAHHGLKNRDGTVCGRECIIALYKNAP